MRDLKHLADRLGKLTLDEASKLRTMLETKLSTFSYRESKMRFTKGRGLTPSEQILADLCERSFLSLWSYPNLFRKPGKELTDLLVVFGDDVILFSDKSCAFPKKGDELLDWKRWFRRSIFESAEQITKAETCILRTPKEAYLDARATQRIPLELPPADRIRFYRVLVALNAGDRCQAATGFRTLKVSPSIHDDERPFTVGCLSNTNGWIHVFDDVTLPVVLSELSTVADFLEYLRKKEDLYDGDMFASSHSELDLLAFYLWNNRSFPEPAGAWNMDPGLWQIVEKDPQFLAARKANEVSAFWDRLIERLNGLYMREELEHGNDHKMSDHERMLRIMAGETRFTRRLLSNWILERAQKAKDGYVGSLLASPKEDVLYVLLIGPGDGGANHEHYRKVRSEQLLARCHAAKAAQPDRRLILGIGLDAMGVKGTSEDFILLDTANWTPEQIGEAEKLRQELKIFVSPAGRLREDEYPVPPQQ